MTMEQLEREMLSRPVHSLQYMLRQLSRRYSFLPALAVDGIFGEKTLEAVMLFQRELAPPVTGRVDQGTWDAIREEWIALEREEGGARELRAFPEHGGGVEPGETSRYMVLPQTMFRLLGQELEGIVPDQADGYHGKASVENTLWLQRRAMLSETGVLDRRTWDMLGRLYEVFVLAPAEKVRK